jgi:hypothetical protein
VVVCGLVMWRGGEEEKMSRATRWAVDGLVKWRRRCGRGTLGGECLQGRARLLLGGRLAVLVALRQSFARSPVGHLLPFFYGGYDRSMLVTAALNR